MQPAARPNPTAAYLLPVALSVFLGGCSLLPGASLAPKEAALRELAGRQAQWQSRNVDDYAFTITRQCFCPFTDPLDVTVVDGVTTAVTSDGQPVDQLEAQGVPKTMADLFAIVTANADAAALTVEWDAVFGFPTSIQVDSIANAIDDEFGIIVTNFRPAS